MEVDKKDSKFSILDECAYGIYLSESCKIVKNVIGKEKFIAVNSDTNEYSYYYDKAGRMVRRNKIKI